MDNQERPMCMSQGKEYSKSKNPKNDPRWILLDAVCLDHFHGKTFVPVFEEKSKERKNVNDGHMFAAEVFVHEILQQEAHNSQNKEDGCC